MGFNFWESPAGQPGGCPNDFAERKIGEYAELVGADAFYLGVANALMFAEKDGKSFS